MKLRTLPILLALCLLAGCTSGAPKEGDFSAFLEEVTTQRKAGVEGGALPDLSAATGDYTHRLEDFTRSEMDALAPDGHAASTITTEQAAQDVETLFKLLGYAYAGYDYFGGDGVFLPAKEAVLSALTGTYCSTRKLDNILSDALAPLIQDGHFYLSSRALISDKLQFMYYVPDLYFADSTGLDERYVKPTIGPDGAVTHCFAALSHDGGDLPAQAVLDGETVPLAWVRAEPLPQQGEPVYTRLQAGGIPVLVNRTMGAVSPALYQTQSAQLAAFAHAGPEWADEPLFLLDIRGNTGGQPAFSAAWLERLTGQPPAPWRTDAVRNSLAVTRDGVLPAFYRGLGLELEPAGTWTVSTQEGRWTENDSLIFVLTDKTTASAAEFFIRNLRTLNGVIFVGSNSFGCLLAGGIRYFQLPNSGLFLSFGTMLSPAEDGGNLDGVGYLPDLWVNPTDAQEAVVRLIQHYDLKGD